MPEFVTVTLSEKGQLVLPKQLRNKYHLVKGVKLVVIEENNKIILERADEVLEKVKETEARRNPHATHHETDNLMAQTPNTNGSKPRDMRDAREIH